MSNWQEKEIGEVCSLIVDCVNRTAKTVSYETPYKMIRTTNIKEGKIDLFNVRYVEENVYDKWIRRGKPVFNDIILTREAPVGEVGILKSTNHVFLGQRTMMYRANCEMVDSEFLYYSLLSPYLQEQVHATAMGSVVEHIRVPDAKKFMVKLPPLSEQKAIASVLSSLDDKIDLLHRQNKTLEAMAETLFRQWFVEGVEEDWKEGTLPDEFDFTMGQSPPGSSFNEESSGTPMFQGNADFGFRFPKDRIYTNDPKRFAELYETLISVRAPVGAQNMAVKHCCIGRGVAAFRCKRNNEFYTYTYFKLRSLMKEIKEFNHTGTVFGSISKADFEKFNIILPPKIIVDKFQREVKPIDDKIISNTKQINNLESMRDALLPKLMSGEVRVEV